MVCVLIQQLNNITFIVSSEQIISKMTCEEEAKRLLLPHHEQQPLCTTRLPYRQGRSLKAVKVYSIVNESIHLLIFGVPSLNLRQETKTLFMKFGKLTQFTVSKDHVAEQFTETYHAAFERIQSARSAKRFLDTKNFYGGTLHICYAPELETVMETRNKLSQRHRDVAYRLKKLQVETVPIELETEPATIGNNEITKLDMGTINTIPYNVSKETNKRLHCKENNIVIEKKFKPCFVTGDNKSEISNCDTVNKHKKNKKTKLKNVESQEEDIEIVDCTSVEKETITNINDSLNYKNFGNETVKVVAQKPLNKIRFTINNKSDT